MRTRKNFDRQIWTLHNLQHAPTGYVTTQYRVDDIEGTPSVMVARRYARDDGIKIGYSEAFIVGPMGGVKEIYSNIEYTIDGVSTVR